MILRPDRQQEHSNGAQERLALQQRRHELGLARVALRRALREGKRPASEVEEDLMVNADLIAVFNAMKIGSRPRRSYDAFEARRPQHRLLRPCGSMILRPPTIGQPSDGSSPTWSARSASATRDAGSPSSRSPIYLHPTVLRSRRAGCWTWLTYDYSLDIHEFTDSKDAQFAAVAAAFDAAERQARVRRDHAIDEDTAGFDAAGEILGQRNVARPQGSPRPYSVSFASCTASSGPLARMTAATGPNVSSRNAGISAVTLSRTVGA